MEEEDGHEGGLGSEDDIQGEQDLLEGKEGNKGVACQEEADREASKVQGSRRKSPL